MSKLCTCSVQNIWIRPVLWVHHYKFM